MEVQHWSLLLQKLDGPWLVVMYSGACEGVSFIVIMALLLAILLFKGRVCRGSHYLILSASTLPLLLWSVFSRYLYLGQ